MDQNPSSEINLDKNSNRQRNIIILISYYQSSEWSEFLKTRKDLLRKYVEFYLNEMLGYLLDEPYEYQKQSENFIHIKFSNSYLNNDDEINLEHPFLSAIKHPLFSYKGKLDKKFQRVELGRNDFTNKDIYLGEWKENLKNGFGLYFYNPDSDLSVEKELYLGEFIEDTLKNDGFFYKQTHNGSSKISFLGKFDANNYSKEGILINQDENLSKCFIYKGKFLDNYKHDTDGFYYGYENGLLFHGNILKDKIGDGYLFNLSRNKQIMSVVRLRNKNREVVLDRNELNFQISIAEGFLSSINFDDLKEFTENIQNTAYKLEEKWRFYDNLISDEDLKLMKEDLDALKFKILNK